MPETFLTVREVAEVSGYHEETVTEALRLGELIGHQHKKGARWRIRETALETWLLGSLAVAA